MVQTWREHPPFEGTEFQVKVLECTERNLRGIHLGARSEPTPKLRFKSGIRIQLVQHHQLANACAKNPYPPIVPCHRVVRSDGGFGGYSGAGGVETKRHFLLTEEGVSTLFIYV